MNRPSRRVGLICALAGVAVATVVVLAVRGRDDAALPDRIWVSWESPLDDDMAISDSPWPGAARWEHDEFCVLAQSTPLIGVRRLPSSGVSGWISPRKSRQAAYSMTTRALAAGGRSWTEYARQEP